MTPSAISRYSLPHNEGNATQRVAVESPFIRSKQVKRRPNSAIMSSCFTQSEMNKEMKTIKTKLVTLFAVGTIAAVLVPSASVIQAQDTSRQIPFTNLATILPQKSTQALTVQLQDAAGAVLFAEAQPQVAVDNKGQISVLFGGLTTGGLDPTHFASGSSRFVDVVDAVGVSILAKGR